MTTNTKLYKHKGRGHSPKVSILRTRNKVPEGESWCGLTCAMLESPAWRAMPHCARQVVDRIIIEHMHHGGTENGKLPVTYDDFRKYGVRRAAVPFGIRASEALGFIDITEQGHAGAANTRRAARYALTWVDRYDGTPRTNRWKAIQTTEKAEEIVARIREQDADAIYDRYRRQPGLRTRRTAA